MKQPRLGHINFINCLPLTYSLQTDDFQRGLEVRADVPSALNALIVSDGLDVSPVSSIVYAQNADRLMILPDVSITADGEVQSILLVAKKPIGALGGETVILSSKSATSHCLLKIIMNKAYGAAPAYQTRAIDMNRIVPDDAAAALLIGDDALLTNHNRRPGFYYYDLGVEWKKLTGLRMVYAVWAARRDFIAQSPRLLQLIYERVTRGFQNGRQKKDKAIRMLLENGGPFTYAQLDDYLRVIQWDLGEEHLEALEIFYQYAQDLRLIERAPNIKRAEVIPCG